MTKILYEDELKDYLYETLTEENKLVDKNGNSIDIDDVVEVLMLNEKIINAWNKTFTVEDKDLNKALDKLSRAIEIACKENFGIVINVF